MKNKEFFKAHLCWGCGSCGMSCAPRRGWGSGLWQRLPVPCPGRAQRGWRCVLQADSSWRRERILHVPLCREDCEQWWQDCRDALTCKDNWHKGWNWATGTNRCPWGSVCRPFSQVFPRPKDLCEKIWSHSFSYSPERRGSGRCIQMWFDPAQGNPNVAVAEHYAWRRRSSPAQEGTLAPQSDGAARALPRAGLLLLPLALLLLLPRELGAGGSP